MQNFATTVIGWLLVGLLTLSASAHAADDALNAEQPPEPATATAIQEDKWNPRLPRDDLFRHGEGVGITERRNNQLPLDLTFKNQAGRMVKLEDLFAGERPVILTFNYSSCPMLCSLQLDGLVAGLKELDENVGQDFDVVRIGINPLETTEQATTSRSDYLRKYGRPETRDGWHFLVGSDPQIRRLAKEAGFGYNFVPETGEYSHTAAVIICTPEGRISRYLYGVEYQPETLRLSLVEAGQGKIGSVGDQFILLCYQYDPESGSYGPAVLAIMRLAAFVTLGLLACLLVPAWLYGQRRGRPRAALEPNHAEAAAS